MFLLQLYIKPLDIHQTISDNNQCNSNNPDIAILLSSSSSSPPPLISHFENTSDIPTNSDNPNNLIISSKNQLSDSPMNQLITAVKAQPYEMFAIFYTCLTQFAMPGLIPYLAPCKTSLSLSLSFLLSVVYVIISLSQKTDSFQCINKYTIYIYIYILIG